MHVRHNLVTSQIISNCVSILEFINRFVASGMDRGSHARELPYPSLTHAATVAFIFECINVYHTWGPRVRMSIIIDPAVDQAMQTYVGPRKYVDLIRSTDTAIYINRYINEDRETYKTVVLHGESLIRLFLAVDMPSNVDVNMVVDINTLVVKQTAREVRTKLDLLIEICPYSDLKLNIVRMIPTHTHSDRLTMPIRLRRDNIPIFAFMRWYTIITRRMKVKTTCYEYAIALEFSYAIVHVMLGRPMHTDGVEKRNWAERFASVQTEQ
jgi:hypothetical protein